MTDYRRTPKQALVDALRNANLGPSNISQQDKPDLESIARSALATWDKTDPPRAAALRESIRNETDYQIGGRRSSGVRRPRTVSEIV